MTHMIRQEYLHVEVHGTEAEALALQRTLPGLCRNWLTPAIDRALERSTPPVGLLRIEKVELDLGTVQLERLEHDLAQAVERGLEKWLHEHPPLAESAPSPVSGAMRRDAAPDPAMDALVHFLRNGTLPWWFRLPGGSSLEQVILRYWQEANSSELAGDPGHDPLLRALADASAGKRLARQFSPDFLQALLVRLSPVDKKVAEDIREERRLWEQEAAVATTSSPGSWQDEHPEAREGLYIENAGLVLLHPFLPQLFAALGIAEEDRLLQPERALCLLHYLGTGQAVAPEYELVLPKILCGVPLRAPVGSDSALNVPEKEEAVALLQAVIGHWDALRNSSPDELRGAFLLRPGKVSRRDEGDWLLQVESQTCDILLDRLPWGFSAIQLPWMETMLWVEWG
ncbi:hypothetical protein EG829_06915 [bacterium]|nr:hypothetical protein [bacterium]